MIDRKTLRILRKRDRGLYDRIIAVLRITKGKGIPWSEKKKCWVVPPEWAGLSELGMFTTDAT